MPALELPASEYHADRIGHDEPSLNASLVKILVTKSPRHAWYAHPRLNPQHRESIERKFDVGTVAHDLFLLDNAERVAVADFPDWRKKAAQEFRDAARDEGMVPLLAHEWARVQAMVAALRDQCAGHEARPPLFVDGQPERTLVWRERGVLCRALLDWLHDSHQCIDDLKTAKWTASPRAWARRTMFSTGADIQAAFYIRAVRAVYGQEAEFRLVVIESDEPHGMSVVSPSPAALVLADAKIEAAIDRWQECLASGVWPGYPLHVVEADPPAWAESDWWESQQLEDDAA